MSLDEKIIEAIKSTDESLEVNDFAIAVAKVLKNEYGSHNYSKFIDTLRINLA